jgi:hypothetical protein
MSEDDNNQFEKLMNYHYAATGRAAAVWAEFEHAIHLAIWRLGGIDSSKGACITTQIGNSNRLMDALIALVDLSGNNGETLKSLRSFQADVGNYQRMRNRIVHDPWAFRLPDASPFRYELSAQRTLVNDLIPQSTNEINQFVQKVGNLIGRLDEILS